MLRYHIIFLPSFETLWW